MTVKYGQFVDTSPQSPKFAKNELYQQKGFALIEAEIKALSPLALVMGSKDRKHRSKNSMTFRRSYEQFFFVVEILLDNRLVVVKINS